MSPVNVKSNTYINSSKETSNKDPKFKTGDIVRLSIWKNIKIFLKKVTLQIDLKNFLWLKELKNSTADISDLKGKEIVGTFYQRIVKNKSKRVYSWESNKEKRW